MNNLPRNMNLRAFDPHRADFVCKHEAEVNPPIMSEAEELFQQGMAATSYELIWPQDKRDYQKAAQLWLQSAAKGHWKAAMNLAGLYEQGLGVERDTEKAVQIVEGLMKAGVPAAFDKMGTYHQRGIGVKSDTSRAFAFWQLAADMGSSAAQAYLGEKLDAAYDNPSQGFWGNREVGLKMLECSYAQGDPRGSYELGLTLRTDEGKTPEYHARVLKVLHDGVKFGSKDSANSLSVVFRRPQPLTGYTIDKDRADRYSILGDALELNPDLRFPNLDKVLPLPPASLPQWDGKRQTLIDAAKGLIPAPTSKPTPGSQRTGRAHIPQGHVLTGAAQPSHPVEANVPVPRSGYWLPQLRAAHRPNEHEWQQAQVPLRYARGESFDTQAVRATLGKNGMLTAPGTVWYYMGEAVPQTERVHPKVAQGIARTSRVPEPNLICRGHKPCPRTGIWYGYLPDKHPLAARYNRWDRQTYLEEGQAFPDPAALQLDVAQGDVRWLWCDNANAGAATGGVTRVTLSDLHDAQGKPLA